MDRQMTNKHYKYGSKMEGAIMMSNMATKQECLARKLFGLPHDKIKFAEKIKAGMLLFLFEYEDRKLYGVFEATTDGAMNIVPDAFLSSGKSFPAQVSFRRVWMCRPLSEDDFCPAIIDNYYSPKKFNFDLSYDQVCKLVEMFSLRRINIKQDLKYVPNKIIRMFNTARRTPKPHFTHPERQFRSRASLDSSVSSLEISSFSQDLISNANSSNSTEIFDCYDPNNHSDEVIERYDPNNPAITSLQERDYEKETNSPLSDEYYPSVVEPKLRSDIEPKRTSVFSRLSVHPAAEKKRKCFSADDKLIMSARSSTQPKMLEGDMSSRRSTAEFVKESVVDVDAFIEDCIAEVRPNLKLIREAEKSNAYAEGGTDEKKLESQSREVVNKTVQENISVCLNNDGLPSESIQGKVASGSSEKGSICLKKEVKSRNLLWFLEKPIDVKAKKTKGSSSCTE